MQKFVSMSNKAGEKLKSGVGLWSQQSFQIVKMFLYFLKNVRDSLTRTKKTTWKILALARTSAKQNAFVL